jgi:hypothetical protein
VENTAPGPTFEQSIEENAHGIVCQLRTRKLTEWLGSVGSRSAVSKGPISTPQYASEGLVIADMGTVLFCLRLLWDVDAKLRKQLGRRGELVTLIVLILNTIDLNTVPVLELGAEIDELLTTTVKLPANLHADLKRIASSRHKSMNALMNSAIWAYIAEKSRRD